MKPAIRVENIGKSYQIAHAAAPREKYKTLRDSLSSLAMAPIRRLRNGGADTSTEEFWALKDVSFEVQPGEVVGIIGRNGAGKSTLLKILSRITKPTTGRVTLNGRVGSLLEVGTGFHPELTGRENVYLNGSILGMSRSEIEKRFDEIIEFSGVERFLDTPIKRYSSGMQVRLAFSVAAHLNPEILIVDEVLAVGDVEFQEKCLSQMQAVARSGRTVLLVSHNLAAVARLCSRAICFRTGMLNVDGAVDAALKAYVSDPGSTSGDFDGGGLGLRLTFNNGRGEPLNAWANSEELLVVAEVSAPFPVFQPALDLAFYSDSGARVFAVQSDRVTRVDGSVRRAAYRFSIKNVGLACNYLTVDAGIRIGDSAEYAAWWQRVTTLAVSRANVPRLTDSDVLIALPTTVDASGTL